jgi:hypothetical protein
MNDDAVEDFGGLAPDCGVEGCRRGKLDDKGCGLCLLGVNPFTSPLGARCLDVAVCERILR